MSFETSRNMFYEKKCNSFEFFRFHFRRQKFCLQERRNTIEKLCLYSPVEIYFNMTHTFGFILYCLQGLHKIKKLTILVVRISRDNSFFHLKHMNFKQFRLQFKSIFDFKSRNWRRAKVINFCNTQIVNFSNHSSTLDEMEIETFNTSLLSLVFVV